MDQCKVSTNELHRLLDSDLENNRAKPTLLKALLDATVHVYASKSPSTTGKLELIQVGHPGTGEWVVPFFTDIDQAKVGADGRWSVISMPGRYFFEITRGSTLVANPYDVAVILHPVEIEALLKGQDLGTFAVGRFTPDGTMTLSVPTSLVLDLFDMLLADHLANEPWVETIHVAEMHGGTNRTEHALLVEIIATETHAVRLVQKFSQILLPFEASFPLPVRLACRRRDNALLAGRPEARQIQPATARPRPHC